MVRQEKTTREGREGQDTWERVMSRQVETWQLLGCGGCRGGREGPMHLVPGLGVRPDGGTLC